MPIKRSYLLCSNQQVDPKIHIETQGTQNSQTTSKKNKTGELTLPYLTYKFITKLQ